ncbi:MAG: oligosaccharide flippase family protein [Candidatus Micrarchaeia archaeon]
MELENTGNDEITEFGSDTAKGSVMFTISKVISSVSVFLMLIILARLLKPVDFGLYALAVAFSTTLHAGGNFGMATALRKKLPEHGSSGEIFKMLSNAYAFSLIVTILIISIGVGISGFLANYAYNNPSLVLPLELGAIMILFSVLFNLTISVLTGINVVKGSSYSVIVYSLVQLAASSLLVLYGYGIVGAIVGSMLGLFFGFLLAAIMTVRKIGFKPVKPEWKGMKELSRFSIPLVASGISVNGSKSFAVLVLGLFASATIVGEYNAAFRVGSFAEVIITSLAFVLLPAFSKAFSSESLNKRVSAIFDNSLYYTILFMLPFVIYTISVSKPLMYLFFTSTYAETPLYFDFIIGGILLGIVGSYGSNLVIGYGDTKRTTKYQVSTVLVELAALIALTPFFKAYGVLLSIFVIGPVLMDIIYAKALKRSFGVTIGLRRILLLLFASLIVAVFLFGAAYFIHGKKIILINAAIAIIAYPPLVALLGGIKKRNIEFIRKVAKKTGMSIIMGPILSYASIFVRNQDRA